MIATPTYPVHSTLKRSATTAHSIVDEFRQHLEMDRGLRAPAKHIATATCFLDFLGDRGKPVGALSKADLDDFITVQGSHYEKATIANLATCLRVFLRFLFLRKEVSKDWSPSVVRPRVFKGRRDPRYLKPNDVRRLLAAQDRSKPLGNRNYAILSLLGICGLRAAEVAHLTLEDIAWRSKVIRVRKRKCDDAIELPLLPTVARALVQYLEVRPPTDSRALFLGKFAPHEPLQPKAVSSLARALIQQAQIEVAHAGSHSFRYAAAQALFQDERPISEIAMVLGHRDLRSTVGYLSFTVDPLRDVAINDGEDLA
jgi:site-specific recombinase XerD